MRKSTLAAALIACLALTGCMTVHTKQMPQSQMGHLYSGVKGDLLAVKCMWETPGHSYHLSRPFVLSSSVMFLADAVLSLIADTLMVPVDLVVKPTHEPLTLDQDCAKPSGA